MVHPRLAGFAVAPARAQRIVTAAERSQAEAYLQQAYTAYQDGDFPQAHHLIDLAQKLQPDQADGWNLRGAVFLKQGTYDRAATAFSRAVALDPNLWAAQFNLGEVAFHQKDYRHARARFEALLDQTDHFKEASRWELAAYKAYLSTLLMGDDAGARKKMAKLPSKGGATPALLYAQAALSFSRKDPSTAQKTLTLAQATYPPAANELFASSLETVGWQAAAPVMPTYASPLPPPGTAPYVGGSQKPMQIDPRLEAAVADPLPSPGTPVYSKVPAVTQAAGRDAAATLPAGKPSAKASPTPATPGPEPDHAGLLLP